MIIWFFFHMAFADSDHAVRYSHIDDSGMAPACLRKHSCG